MPILLFLAATAAASGIPDNAGWMRETIAGTFAMPESLLQRDTAVCVKPAQANHLHELAKHALLDFFHGRHAMKLQNGADSESDCPLLLEFRILTMKTRIFAKKKWGILHKRSFRRIAEYELLLNLYSRENGALLWTGTAGGTRSQDLPWKERSRIANALYPELEAAQERSGKGIWLDTMILLGSAICLIYFLYR